MFRVRDDRRRIRRWRFSVTREDDGALLGRCHDVAGLSGDGGHSRGDLVELDAFSPEGRFLSACDGGGKAISRLGNVNVNVLDRDEKIIGSYFLAAAELVEARRRNGDARLICGPEPAELWDVVLCGALLAPAHPRALACWARWQEHLPEQPGAWAPLSTDDRTAWLEVVRLFRGERAQDAGGREGAVFVLDGRYATDPPGLFCALGEALCGPGGYYGADLDGVHDCLRGGLGPVPPFTLQWVDSAIARAALAGAVADDPGDSLFDVLVQTLRDAGVNVELR